MPDEPEVHPPCRCGREVRKLNPASDDAKCVGCGYVPDLCGCSPTHARRQELKGRYRPIRTGETAYA